MDLTQELSKVIYKEMGQKSADLFSQFYHDFSEKEQVTGALSLLILVVGPERSNELLKNYIKKYF